MAPCYFYSLYVYVFLPATAAVITTFTAIFPAITETITVMATYVFVTVPSTDTIDTRAVHTGA